MTTHPFHSTGQVPPRPNERSGQPRPPRAPRKFGDEATTPNDRQPRKAPEPPTEQGPRLEWYQESPLGAFKTAIWAFVIMFVALVLIWQGFEWVSYWYNWLLPPVVASLVYFTSRKGWVAAGARWLQHKNTWVDTYDLTEIKIGANGANQVLKLTDSAGRRIQTLPLRDVQANADLWDLVYNGILHSTVNGKANPPRGTRTILKLPGA